MNILVSACLLGINCRYDGSNNFSQKIASLKDKHNLFPFCPEAYGGLPTPRQPSEIVGDRVMSKDGADVTIQFVKGAKGALESAVLLGCDCAILKERSPSCSSRCVYDGSFSKKLIEGYGVTAKLLMDNGIAVFGESELDKLMQLE